MSNRNYIILKSPNDEVEKIYILFYKVNTNTYDINCIVGEIVSKLYHEQYDKGYDILIGCAQNLNRLRDSLPELKWNKAIKEHVNIE